MKKKPTDQERLAYKSKKLRLYRKQGGRCAWGECGSVLPRFIGHCDLAHLVGSGMGGDRYDETDPRNHDDNCRLMHRECHQEQEASLRRKKRIGHGQ